MFKTDSEFNIVNKISYITGQNVFKKSRYKGIYLAPLWYFSVRALAFIYKSTDTRRCGILVYLEDRLYK